MVCHSHRQFQHRHVLWSTPWLGITRIRVPPQEASKNALVKNVGFVLVKRLFS